MLPRSRIATLLALAACGAAVLALLTAAWAESPSASTDAAEVRAGARGLFVLSGGIGAFTAQDRAAQVNRRIEQILRSKELQPGAIQDGILPDGSPGIQLGSLQILEVTDADAEAAGTSRAELAAQWAGVLRANLTQLQPLYAREKSGISVKTLSEHHVLLLIIQVAALLLAARLCGDLALRLGQAPVVGQLVAGILLGQSFLGALWPDLKALVFPVEATQSYLLEVVSWLGVLFLLMLTGLETDVGLIRKQGRPALFTSISGIVVPFLLGAGVGYLLPVSLLTTPESRLVLSLFLGTVLSVSSVPVIAKILLDMQLLRRSVGQLILAAALAHDTVGWVILALVASLAARGTIDVAVVGKTLLGTVVFGVVAATVGRVAVRRILRWVNDRLRVEHALLTAVVVLMLLCSATTQIIGVHAVLGAFTIGILLRESPVINEKVLHPIETVTTAVFAPIFFAAAGLHVNLGVLSSPPLLWAGILLTGAACVGKMAGCYFGARWGGAEHWNAVSVGIGTNARGAMGMIVGILGFSLGILTVDMFSLIIVMAVVTTAITPPLLRWSLSRVKPDQEEQTRLRQERLRDASFIGRIQRVLLPSRGGLDARLAGRLVNAVAAQHPVAVTGLYVQSHPGDATAAEVHDSVRAEITANRADFEAIVLPPGPPVERIQGEASRGYDLLALGCGADTGVESAVFGSVVDTLVRDTDLPLLVVRAPRGGAEVEIRHLLVPTTGIVQSVQAAELAIAVARSTGARVTAMHVYEPVDDSLFWLENHEQRAREAGEDALEQVRSLGEAYGIPVEVLLVRGERAGLEIIRAARERSVDLIILGGGLRATRRLFFGTTVTSIIRGAECAVAVLRP